MNRTTLFGIAMFFAVLAIAVMGSDNQVSAGIGCGGLRNHGGLFRHHRACAGVAAAQCCGEAPVAACAGADDCGGRRRCGGLLARLRARHACRGAKADCCGQAAPVCEPACAAPVADLCCTCDRPVLRLLPPVVVAVVEPVVVVRWLSPAVASVIMEAAPIEAPAEAEVAPEVPPAPAEEAAEGSA